MLCLRQCLRCGWLAYVRLLRGKGAFVEPCALHLSEQILDQIPAVAVGKSLSGWGLVCPTACWAPSILDLVSQMKVLFTDHSLWEFTFNHAWLRQEMADSCIVLSSGVIACKCSTSLYLILQILLSQVAN